MGANAPSTYLPNSQTRGILIIQVTTVYRSEIDNYCAHNSRLISVRHTCSKACVVNFVLSFIPSNSEIVSFISEFDYSQPNISRSSSKLSVCLLLIDRGLAAYLRSPKNIYLGFLKPCFAGEPIGAVQDRV